MKFRLPGGTYVYGPRDTRNRADAAAQNQGQPGQLRHFLGLGFGPRLPRNAAQAAAPQQPLPAVGQPNTLPFTLPPIAVNVGLLPNLPQEETATLPAAIPGPTVTLPPPQPQQARLPGNQPGPQLPVPQPLPQPLPAPTRHFVVLDRPGPPAVPVAPPGSTLAGLAAQSDLSSNRPAHVHVAPQIGTSYLDKLVSNGLYPLVVQPLIDDGACRTLASLNETNALSYHHTRHALPFARAMDQVRRANTHAEAEEALRLIDRLPEHGQLVALARLLLRTYEPMVNLTLARGAILTGLPARMPQAVERFTDTLAAVALERASTIESGTQAIGLLRALELLPHERLPNILATLALRLHSGARGPSLGRAAAILHTLLEQLSHDQRSQFLTEHARQMALRRDLLTQDTYIDFTEVVETLPADQQVPHLAAMMDMTLARLGSIPDSLARPIRNLPMHVGEDLRRDYEARNLALRSLTTRDGGNAQDAARALHQVQQLSEGQRLTYLTEVTRQLHRMPRLHNLELLTDFLKVASTLRTSLQVEAFTALAQVHRTRLQGGVHPLLVDAIHALPMGVGQELKDSLAADNAFATP